MLKNQRETMAGRRLLGLIRYLSANNRSIRVQAQPSNY